MRGGDDGFDVFKDEPATPRVRKLGVVAANAAGTSSDKAHQDGSAPDNGHAGEPGSQQPPQEEPWPLLRTEDAHIGLAWEVVEAIAPNTEADPLAILIDLLVMFGNVIGRGPYFQVEGDRHHTNLFAVLVGKSSRGRKGTAEGRVRQLMQYVDEDWVRDRKQSGLSSGEGLIWAVRDPIKRMVKGQEETLEPGVTDKRLLVTEPEFGLVLGNMKREKNSLSPTMRNAWDGHEKLQTMTKDSRNFATKAHISILGSITAEELKQQLDRTSMMNGFGNRFLFACVRRSQLLPFGGGFSEPAIAERLGAKLRLAVDRARALGRVTMNSAAEELWRNRYPSLTAERHGILDGLTARSAPQTLRLALVYALLCSADTMDVEHLKAALAVWDFCDASARMIFGGLLGDPVGDEILRALTRAGRAGVSRTDISGLFGRNRTAEEIGAALFAIEKSGRARALRVPAGQDGRGRPIEMWYATAI